MIGRILNYRRSRHRTRLSQYIVVVEGVSNREEAANLVGRKVVWRSAGKRAKIISGKIAALHGNKGGLRVLMQRGLPGQAIGSAVEIKE